MTLVTTVYACGITDDVQIHVPACIVTDKTIDEEPRGVLELHDVARTVMAIVQHASRFTGHLTVIQVDRGFIFQEAIDLDVFKETGICRSRQCHGSSNCQIKG